MAQHDFINKKKPTKTKNNNKNQKKPLPVFLLISAFILVSLFAYGLWFIKTQSNIEDKPTTTKTEQNKKESLAKPKPPIFLEDIKNHKVEVDIKEIETEGPYVMQCGSFKTHAQADKLKAKIAFAGLLSDISRTEGKNGIWYRVRLGPFETKRLAESAKNSLKRQKIMGCSILKWT